MLLLLVSVYNYEEMTADEFIKIWTVLKQQVESLQVPWLDAMASRDRDPFRVLISCILSLRTQDKVTGEASERLFRLAPTPDKLAELQAKTIEKAIYPVGSCCNIYTSCSRVGVTVSR